MRERERKREGHIVCVCLGEREGEKESERKSERERKVSEKRGREEEGPSAGKTDTSLEVGNFQTGTLNIPDMEISGTPGYSEQVGSRELHTAAHFNN